MRPHTDANDAGFRHLLILGFVLVTLLAGTFTGASAQQVIFPDSKAGWEAQLRDKRDVSAYLAFHKQKASEGMAEAIARGQSPNQAQYDARFYDLDLDLDPDARILTGTVAMKAEVVSGPLHLMEIDLDNILTVSSVTSGGFTTTYTHASDLLTVDLDRPYNTGEIVDIVVQYSGNPQPGGAFWWDSHGGEDMISTLSEPYGARTWWPCKDYPIDKPDSLYIRVTAPSGMITASNGKLIEMSDNGTTATAVWHETWPITTYLVSIASHPYSVWSDYYHYAPGDSMEIQFYIFPDDVAESNEVNLKVKDMMVAMVDLFGEYPFLDEKYAHAQFLWGGGMEHQTCTSLGGFWESVVAHELGHQWWGDMISPETFHHIWLNEGFATYSEALWFEAVEGPEGLHRDMSYNAFYGPGTIFVENPDDFGSIFDSNLSYNKASWVLHMLRHVVGDDAFWDCLAAYRAQYEHSVANTEQFQAVCEGVTGLDLEYFFQEWIYGEYYPEYFFTYETIPVAGGYDVNVTLEQTQSWQIFQMPVDISIETESGEETFVVMDSLASQVFSFHVEDPVIAVRIDKDNWILKTVQEVVVNPPFDRSILLVNGVLWGTYLDEIYDAYEAKAFWGDYEIDFWDHFAEPAGGYPSTLPEPLGHGPIPASVIGHYRNVIWVGNNYGGDIGTWANSPMMSYLETGGNILLMTRHGDDFLTEPFRQYLGINWYTAGTNIYDCQTVYFGLTDIARTGTQSYCNLFQTTLTEPESRLLYEAQQSYEPDRGIGVWRKPAAGGTDRPNGAQLAFLSGRPYRWDHTDLKTNIMFILENFFEEPVDQSSVDDAGSASVLRLDPARPNPLTGSTTLQFALPSDGAVSLSIFDVAGRKVRSLVDGPMAAGPHAIVWDGQDDLGHPVSAGIYWAHLNKNGRELTRKVTVIR